MYNDFWFDLHRITAKLGRYLTAKLKDHGLTAQQFIVLSVLFDEGYNITDAAKCIGIDRTTLSRNALPLLERQLIEQVGIRDRRATKYILTPKGEQLLAKAHAAWQEHSAAIMTSLGATKSKNLLQCLQDLDLYLTKDQILEPSHDN